MRNQGSIRVQGSMGRIRFYEEERLAMREQCSLRKQGALMDGVSRREQGSRREKGIMITLV